MAGFWMHMNFIVNKNVWAHGSHFVVFDERSFFGLALGASV